MRPINNISAVIFDMDGTLVDSEPYTGQAIKRVCSEMGIHNVGIERSLLDGLSWEDIEKEIVGRYPVLGGRAGLSARLHEAYHLLLKEKPPASIKCARIAVIAASKLVPTAIVSSSYRESIEETICRMGIARCISFYAGREDYSRAKPEPDGYLKAAETLGVKASECLVFEDSIPGIQAALKAGMQVVAITQGGSNVDRAGELADMVIRDFSELEDGFFEHVTKGGA